MGDQVVPSLLNCMVVTLVVASVMLRFRVTEVEFVYAASLLMVKVPVGAALSTVKAVELLPVPLLVAGSDAEIAMAAAPSASDGSGTTRRW